MTYPEREKQELKIFDVREYVKNARQKKIQDMMGNQASPEGGSFLTPGAQVAMPASPAATPQARPLTESRPVAEPNPRPSPFKQGVPAPATTPNANLKEIFSNDREEVAVPPKANDDYNVADVDIDDLVKKIDAKIAELEKEEEAEKKKAASVAKAVPEPVKPVVPELPKASPIKEEKNIEKDIEATINELFGSSKDAKPTAPKQEEKPASSSNIYIEDDIDDDQFFDDFFEN